MADQEREEITGPSGPKAPLDLRVKPLLGIKVKKEAGYAAVFLLCVVAGGVTYSLYHRGEVNQQAAVADEASKTAPSGAEGASALKHDLKARDNENQPENGGITGQSTLNPPPSPASNAGPAVTPPLVVRTASGDVVRLPANGVQAGGGSAAGQAQQQHVPTSAELLQAKQLEAYNAALVADTAASSGHNFNGGGRTNPNSDGAASPAQLLTAAVNRAADRLGSNQQGSPEPALVAPGGGSDPNRQDQKEAFQFRSTVQNDTLTSTREAALSRYEIRAGWDIPATLESGLNSDLPGTTTAIVRENVYDTATGAHLLIPQGSRLLGLYNSQITYGQARVQIAWSRLIYPDGTAVSLGNMPGVDAEGVTGFHDKVDNHYKRLVSEALLSSAFAAGIGLSQKQNTNAFSTPTNGQLISGAVGQQLGQVGSELTRKNIDIQPTVIVRPGYRFNVRVTKDIVFDQPYTPLYQ